MTVLTTTVVVLLPLMLKSPTPPVLADGPGLAGCPASWPMAGMDWSFTWSNDAGGAWWCVPMLRSNRQDNVASTMNTCGGLGGAVLVGNEMDYQERCWVDCQVRFLYEVYPQIRAENPEAQVVFWNGPYPSAGWVDLFTAEWQAQYPGELLPQVDIGVHLYLWPGKEPGSILASLARFETAVNAAWPGADVLVTEGGSLHSEAEHQRWLRDVMPHLDTFAVFDCWQRVD